jgi:ABC-2 type transport system permease protein
MSALRAQLRAEIALVRRNGEQLLVTLGIPLALLGFFSVVDVLPSDTPEAVDFLVPGILALAIMSTSMVSLGIATGFERSYLVLKRLSATPLGPRRLVAAKTISVAIVEIIQMMLLVGLGLALGWSPLNPNWILTVVAVILGTTAFAGIGLTLAGTLRGEINLAATNALYLLLLLLGGILFPQDRLPGAMQAVSDMLPTTALAEVLRDTLMSSGDIGSAWWVLVVWAVAAPLAATRFFRWN